MAKFLFVVPPFFGHISPTIIVGNGLIERGHEVVWTGIIPMKDELFPQKGKYIYATEELAEYQSEIDYILKIQDDGPKLSVLEAAVLATEKTAIPLAKIMMKAVNRVVDEFQPDIIINDCITFAGALVAHKRGIPLATTIPVPPDVMGNPDSMPKIVEWHKKRVLDLQHYVGIEGDEVVLYSDKLALIFTSKEFSAIEDAPACAKFVGPVVGRPNDIPFDWDRLSKVTTPKVYVTLGTLLVDIRKDYFTKLIEAFGDKPITIIAATDPSIIEQWPDNFIVQDFVPQEEIIKQSDAIICHGGFNTVNDAIRNELPILITPIAYDHFHTANLIEKAGCGISIKYKRLRINHLVDAMNSLLTDVKYKEGVRKIKQTYIEAGGKEKAVDYLEELYESLKH